MYYLKISSRSFFSKWRQYISLFLVSMIGVGISLFSMALIDGMLTSLSMKAKIYYAGDFQILGGLDNMDFYNSSDYVSKIESVVPGDAVVAKRRDYDATDCFLCYEGTDARIRVIKAVDFNKEKILFSKLNFIEGSSAELSDREGIVISEPIAKLLSIHVGDSLTLVMSTLHGNINSANLVVKGIFRDSSLFGMYTTYMDYDLFIKLNEDENDYANRIGVFFPNGNYSEKDLAKYQKRLEKIMNMYPLVDDKYEFYDKLYEGFEKETFALINVDANMNELKLIIKAMKWVSVLIICALVVIIIVGVSSTYRVLVMKRITEIGIYKAIGMARKNIYMILLLESCCLMISGCLAGLLFSGIMCSIVKCFNLSFIPAFDVFLVNGIIVPVMDPFSVILVLSVIFVTTVLAVVFSIRKAVEITPVQALATTE